MLPPRLVTLALDTSPGMHAYANTGIVPLFGCAHTHKHTYNGMFLSDVSVEMAAKETLPMDNLGLPLMLCHPLRTNF